MATALGRQAGDLRAFARYARGLRAFVAHPPGPGEAERGIAAAVAGREAAFLATLDRAVYGVPRSPYRRLLVHAGVEPGDARRLVADHGVEGALERLFDLGVRLSADELRGRVPVRRGGLDEFTVDMDDLDNPSADGPAHLLTGSSGFPRRARFELGLLAHEALHQDLGLRSMGLENHAYVLWRPVPPGLAGMNDVLRCARAGRPVERWFSQFPTRARPGMLRHSALVGLTRAAARRSGLRIPQPEHVPVDRAAVVAAWLDERKRAGAAPALVNAPASSGVRVCAAALEGGHDIAGTVFRLGGEPLTAARVAVVADAGCTVFAHYAMTETGRIGCACGSPAAPDDVHVLLDKVAVIQRPLGLADGTEVGALYCSTLLPLSPKVMLNIESGDYGVLEERACECPFGELGLGLHLHAIRSYAKVNSEGMTFAGADLLELLDEVLPRRFGGAPSHWQLVEEERGGVTRIAVVVSPAVGPVDEDAVVETVLATLGRGADYRRLQARVWRDGATVSVRRAEPRLTQTAKVLPLSPPAPRAPSRRA